jgi:hypothetical protein
MPFPAFEHPNNRNLSLLIGGLILNPQKIFEI